MKKTIQSEINFDELFKNLPQLLTAKDLVSIGLFSNQTSAHQGKGRNATPPHIYISERKVRFPKNGLIAWLAAKQDNSE